MEGAAALVTLDKGVIKEALSQSAHGIEVDPGRKLEFLTQEMFREANTIGSKASDVEISREVVEIKATLEKIRELVQNVE